MISYTEKDGKIIVQGDIIRASDQELDKLIDTIVSSFLYGIEVTYIQDSVEYPLVKHTPDERHIIESTTFLNISKAWYTDIRNRIESKLNEYRFSSF
jgi:hypothetical protein